MCNLYILITIGMIIYNKNDIFTILISVFEKGLWCIQLEYNQLNYLQY